MCNAQRKRCDPKAMSRNIPALSLARQYYHERGLKRLQIGFLSLRCFTTSTIFTSSKQTLYSDLHDEFSLSLFNRQSRTAVAFALVESINMSNQESVHKTTLGRIATILAAKQYVSYHTYLLLHVLSNQPNPNSILCLGERRVVMQ